MQQINFYQEEFQVSRDWRKTGAIAAVIVVVLVFAGINVGQFYSGNQLSAELKRKTGTLASLEQSYAALETNTQPKAIDMGLVAEMERMKRSNAEKLRALNYLSSNDAGNMIGFSLLMQALGRKRDTINDLWLKKIKFGRGGYDMHISGSSYQADLLPQFIQALSDEEIYKDREFRDIRILRSDTNHKVMDFILDTRYQVEQRDTANEGSSIALFMARLRQLAGDQEVVQ